MEDHQERQNNNEIKAPKSLEHKESKCKKRFAKENSKPKGRKNIIEIKTKGEDSETRSTETEQNWQKKATKEKQVKEAAL